MRLRRLTAHPLDAPIPLATPADTLLDAVLAGASTAPQAPPHSGECAMPSATRPLASNQYSSFDTLIEVMQTEHGSMVAKTVLYTNEQTRNQLILLAFEDEALYLTLKTHQKSEVMIKVVSEMRAREIVADIESHMTAHPPSAARVAADATMGHEYLTL